MKKEQMFAAFIALTLLTALAMTVGAQAAQDNWGLSFPTKGKAPVGNASSDMLKQYDAVYVGSAESKTIYLTFDAGYENGFTASILDTLQKHEVSAAFFLVGHYIQGNPELTRRMFDEGHTVANHTFHHPDMSKIADLAAFQEELESLEALCRDVTGQEMTRYYRPPQGKYNEQNLKYAKQLGYKTVFWSLAYVDWLSDQQPSRQQAFAKLLPRIHPGAIVLLHSTSRTNAEILDELLTHWKAEGYSFGKLDDLYAA